MSQDAQNARPHWWQALAPKIVALAALSAVLSGALVGATALARARTGMSQGVSHNNLAVADAVADLTWRTVDEVELGVKRLAMRPTITGAVLLNVPGNAQEQLVQFGEFSQLIDSAGILDRQGVIRVTTAGDSRIGTSLADRDYFQQAMATGQPYLGLPVASRATGRPVVPYGVPILDKQGVPQGVVFARMSLESLSNMILHLRSLGPLARPSLLDRRQGGVILVHPDPTRILQPISGRNEASRRLDAGERGTLETRNSAGELDLVSFAPVPNLPWGVLILQPSTAILAPLAETTRDLVLLIAGVTFTMTAVSIWLALRLARPMDKLRRSVNAFSRGDFSTRLRLPQRDEAGHLARAFDQMADTIAERSAQLEASEARYRTIVDTANEAIWTCDVAARITYGNPRLCEMLARGADDVVGAIWFDFVDDAAQTEEQGRFARLNDGIAEHYEVLLRRRDGHDLWVMVSASPVFDPPGTFAGSIAMATDITERKQADNEIRELTRGLERRVAERTEALQAATEAVAQEKTTLAAVMGSMSDGLLLIDGGQSIRYANTRAAELLGFQPEQALAGNVEAVFEQLGDRLLESDSVRLRWEQAMDNPRELGLFEIGLVVPEPRDLQLQCFTVDEATDGQRSVGVVLRDVTAERDLARTKDELVSVVSHELRTPLASLLGFTELLIERELSEAQRQLYLTTMRDDGRRLEALINNLLDLQRMEAGKVSIEPAALNPRDILVQAASSFEDDSRHPIVLDAPEGLPAVRADADAVQQVLGHLVSNARKYSPDGGEVRLGAREVDGMVELSVHDQGLGLSAEALPKLFEKFYRVDNSDHRAIRGTGLGLAISRKIVEAHGGRIWAESAGQGQGSRFAFTLPLVDVGVRSKSRLVVESLKGRSE